MRIVCLLLLSLAAYPQETCRHCDISTLDQQFPAPESQHNRVWDKTLLLSTLGHASAISWDSYKTISKEGHGCYEGSNGFPEIVHGKELAADGLIEFGVTLLATVALKWSAPKHWVWTSYLPQLYGTSKHTYAVIQWRHCK